MADETLTNQLVEVLNTAKLESNNNDKVLALAEAKEIVLFRDKSGKLLEEYCSSIVEFQIDPSTAVRKFIIGFIEEACKVNNTLIGTLFGNLVLLCQSDSSKLAAQSVLTINRLLRRALLYLSNTQSETKVEKEIQEELSKHILTVATLAETSINKGKVDRLGTQWIKLGGAIALCFLPPEKISDVRKLDTIKLVSERAKESGPDSFSSFDVPANHPYLKHDQMEKQGMAIIQGLVTILKQNYKNLPASMVTLNCLSVLVQFRPLARSKVVKLFSELAQSDASKGFKQALKTHCLSCLRVQGLTEWRNELIAILSKLGAQKEAVAIENEENIKEQKLKRSRAKRQRQLEAGNDAKRGRFQVISAEELDILSTKDAVSWIIKNIQYLPSKRPSTTQDAAGKRGSFDQILQLVQTAKTERLAQAAIASPQVIQKVRDFEVKGRTDMALSKMEQPVVEKLVNDAFTRVCTSKMVKLVNRSKMEKNALDLVARLSSNFDNSFNKILVQEFGERFKPNAEFLLTLAHHEYANDLLYPSTSTTKSDNNIALFSRDAQMPRYSKVSLDIFQLSYDDTRIEQRNCVLKYLKELPKVTQDMYAAILEKLSSSSSETGYGFGIETICTIMDAHPGFMELGIETLLLLSFASVNSVRITSALKVVEMYKHDNISTQIKSKIRSFALSGLDAAKTETELVIEGTLDTLQLFTTFLTSELVKVPTNEEEKSTRNERLVGLFLALCTEDTGLIQLYLKTYGEASSEELKTELKKGLWMIDIIARNSSGKIALEHMDKAPASSADLLVESIVRLATLCKDPESSNTTLAELFATTKALTFDDGSLVWEKDARVLAPLVETIPRKEMIDCLPKIFLLEAKYMEMAISNLLNCSDPQVEPVDILLNLVHLSESDRTAVMKVTQFCFELLHVFTSEVCAIVMQKMVEMEPIPAILFRIIALSAIKHPKLKSFLVTQVYARLVKKKVWENDELWENFIQCARYIGSMFTRVLLTLPTPQLDYILNKESRWVKELASFIQKSKLSVPPAVTDMLKMYLKKQLEK